MKLWGKWFNLQRNAKAILDLCKKRWAERHVACVHFYDSYVYIVGSLEFIAHGVNISNYDLQENQDKWDQTSRSDVSSFLHDMTLQASAS